MVNGNISDPMRVMIVLSTRIDAIKAAPIIDRLRQQKFNFDVIIVTTVHFQEDPAPTLALFHLHPDIVLDFTRSRQGLPHLTSQTLESMTITFQQIQPDIILVQGDSVVAFSTLLAACYQNIPVAYLAEDRNIDNPDFPSTEETNRRLTMVMAQLHFVSTRQTRHFLLSEGVSGHKIVLTGNPRMEALLRLSDLPFTFSNGMLQSAVKSGRRFVLFAPRHYMPWGAEPQSICRAALELVRTLGDVDVVYLGEEDPVTRERMTGMLGGKKQIYVIEKPDDMTYVNLLAQSSIILTDSGDVHEDASAFRKPVLMLGDGAKNVKSGACMVPVRSVACAPEVIVQETGYLLKNDKACRKLIDAETPYGDGNAAERIAIALIRWSKGKQPLLTPREEFSPQNTLFDLLCQNL